jgi:hypothetical protein
LAIAVTALNTNQPTNPSKRGLTVETIDWVGECTMHHRHRRLPAICNMTSRSPDLLELIGIRALFGFTGVIVRGSRHFETGSIAGISVGYNDFVIKIDSLSL